MKHSKPLSSPLKVGLGTLTEDVSMSSELADTVVAACAEMGKTVTEQQEREKEEEARRKAEEAEAPAGSEGEAAATSILGGGPAPAVVESDDADAQAAAASILDGEETVAPASEDRPEA